MTEVEWDDDQEEDEEGEAPELDILLYTMAVSLSFHHSGRLGALQNMLETLNLLGLVDRKYLRDEGIFSYTATPTLLRLACESKGFFNGLREFKERGFITRKDLLALRKAFKRKHDFE